MQSYLQKECSSDHRMQSVAPACKLPGPATGSAYTAHKALRRSTCLRLLHG